MPINKYAHRIWRRRIRDVLNRDWDPIGGCPDDEYDSYGGEIAAMIIKEATDEELLTFLEWAEVEHIGLGPPFDHERGVRVVSALRSLGLPKEASNE